MLDRSFELEWMRLVFHASGKILVENNKLKIYNKGGKITKLQFF